MAIRVQRQTDMNPITIMFAGINDHLHSRGFLSRLRDPTTAECTLVNINWTLEQELSRDALTTALKRISRTSERSGKEKAEMLKEDLERNVTLCLHNSFCRNRESNVDHPPCCKQRVEEQKCWRTASNSVRIANDVLQDTETESALSVSQEEEMEH